ncbi:MAG: exodeoxyribonuclease VII large subunit [Elusimicrobia bacterium]|nr:exodeoxyribonuclease VII large subunit [Elusimicrobiota bacterium]
MSEKMKVFTVTEINNLSKILLEENFGDVFLDGEISNFKRHSSGHLYFSLKDERSQISAVMYRFRANSLKFKPVDGIKVRARGSVSIYPVRGSYQILVQEMTERGKGALQEKFEQLFRKLKSEGLMDASRKRPIPTLPRKIGVVTSPTGAAIRDILTVLKRRFANVHIILYPVRVQGELAKDEIAEAIENLNVHFPDVDVLIVGRGGGSLEDLWPFNEEKVARAIFSSKIPVISAVGHEVDWTISDFVADRRAATPSVGAEIVVGRKEEFLKGLSVAAERMEAAVKKEFVRLSDRFRNICSRPYFERPELFISKFEQSLDFASGDVLKAGEKLFETASRLVAEFENRLDLLSPQKILSRGYSITTKKSGVVVKDEKEVLNREFIRVTLFKGVLDCQVKKDLQEEDKWLTKKK